VEFKVCLDAGHGGYDPGAVGPTGLKEKDVALTVTRYVGSILQAAGIRVIYTRTGDDISWPPNQKKDLAARCRIANQADVDFFVSIHCNSVENPQAHGTETYCYQFGGQGEKLARAIQRNLIQTLGLTDRGVKAANFHVLRETEMPAALVEIAFISNPKEEQLLRNVNFQIKAAKAIAEGIAEVLGVQLKGGGVSVTDRPIPVVPDWKKQVAEDALREGITTKLHDPEQAPDKAFVLAVVLNNRRDLVKKIKELEQEVKELKEGRK